MAKVKTTNEDLVVRVKEFVDVVNSTLKTNTIYVGIDPGEKGAIGFLCRGVSTVIDIPRLKIEKRKKGGQKTEPDYHHILQVFDQLNYLNQCDLKVCLEKIPATVGRFKASGVSQFRIGASWGMWSLFLMSKGYELHEVYPAVWKRHYGLIGKDKKASLRLAQKKFPTLSEDLKRVSMDCDRAEALLLADYLKQQEKSNARRPKGFSG